MKEKDFYHKIRGKITDWVNTEGKDNKWASYILMAPDFFYLVWKLSTDERVPYQHRLKLIAVLAYFISPLDLLPEMIFGPAAFTDDIALAAWVLNGLLNEIDEALVYSFWPGEEDVILTIKRVIATADQMVGKGLWKKLQGRIK